MNKYSYAILVIVSSLILVSCSDDDDKVNEVLPSSTGTVVDDQGNEYTWVQIGDQQWTTSNALNGELVTDLTYWNGWSYTEAFSDDEAEAFMEETYPVYGNYMTYEEALASAPEGWRLPTDEDWQKLERTLGMKDTGAEGYRGNGIGFALQEADSGCRLGLLCGGGLKWEAVYGWKELKLTETQEFGYYWTATETDAIGESRQAYYRKICAVYNKVGRNHTGTDRLFSVRWVRDAK